VDDQGRSNSTNRLDEAEGYFRELLKEDAQSYKGLLGLGQVNRLRGNYDEAEDYYRKAARAKSDQVEPRAGVWVSMAYAGRDEEAWNAMTEYYGAGQQMNAEAVRIAGLLTTSRHYETAARLYDRMVESSARPEVIQKLARLLRKTEKVKRDSYEKFYDDSTPEAMAQTLVIANLVGDMDKVFRCLSPAVNRAEAKRLIQAQEGFLNNLRTTLGTNYLADVVLSAFDVSKRTLDDGVVEVKLDASRSGVAALSAFGSVLTLQLQAVSNRWEAVTLSELELDCATLGRLALEALERGDTVRATAWQTRLADLASHPGQRRPASPVAARLQEFVFTNEVLRVKAWAGLGLAGSQDRADKTRAAGCLEDVVAAYPDDSQLKILLAIDCYQLANVRKAATILESIDSIRLAAPDQLGQLAWMLVTLEKLDAADKVLARLREVAPDNDQLVLLQSMVLLYRGKYADAAITVAKLRERGKVDSQVSIPGESMPIALSGNKDFLRDFIEYWREPEKPVAMYRPTMSSACLALDLPDEASEQIATMLNEGGLNVDALASYAEIALIRGDTAEARQLVSVADRLASRNPESESLKNLALVHLALGDYAESARAYCDEGTRVASHYSGYSLCMSALVSRLAGDTATSAETLKRAITLQGDSDWPRMAIQYVNSDISEDELRQAPERTTHTPFMRASRECEVNCIVGLLKESKRDLPGALAAYQASVATKSVTDLEYMIARLALKRLRDTHPGTVEDTQVGTRSTSRL
jgi:tetratricopeptide (TPR) repeat protein